MFDYRIITKFEVHEGTTCDFLELVCQVALYAGIDLAGDWLTAFLTDQTAQLDFLRLIDWKFEWCPTDETSIKIKKYGY
jgi:hypothetical protein